MLSKFAEFSKLKVSSCASIFCHFQALIELSFNENLKFSIKTRRRQQL